MSLNSTPKLRGIVRGADHPLHRSLVKPGGEHSNCYETSGNMCDLSNSSSRRRIGAEPVWSGLGECYNNVAVFF